MLAIILDGFILDGFLQNEFWCTGIQSPCFCKWVWILNWSKWILVVYPTQILISLLLSTDHSSRCKLNVDIITYMKEKPSTTNWYFFAKLVRQWKSKESKIWVRMTYFRATTIITAEWRGLLMTVGKGQPSAYDSTGFLIYLSNLFVLKKSELLLMKAWQFQTCPTANPIKFLYVVMNSRLKSLSRKKNELECYSSSKF